MEATSHGFALEFELWPIVPARDLIAAAVEQDDTMQFSVPEDLRTAELLVVLIVDAGTGCIIFATNLEFELDKNPQLLLTVGYFHFFYVIQRLHAYCVETEKMWR